MTQHWNIHIWYMDTTHDTVKGYWLVYLKRFVHITSEKGTKIVQCDGFIMPFPH